MPPAFFVSLALASCVSTPPPRPPPPTVKAADRPAILLRLGDDLRRTGDAADAVGLYRSANGAQPNDPAALTHLGEGLNDADQPERAEQAFRGALALQPQNDAATRGLAVALLAEHHPADALPLLNQLDTGDHDPHVLRQKGTALDLLGRPAEAQAAYRRGLALAPTDSALHGNLALSLALGGDAGRALSEMRAAIASPAPDPRQEANAILVLALLGRTDEATTRGNQTIGEAATATLLARVDAARRAADAGGRALSLGVITSTSPAAPPASQGLLPPPETAQAGAVLNAAPAGTAAPAPAAGSPQAPQSPPASQPHPSNQAPPQTPETPAAQH